MKRSLLLFTLLVSVLVTRAQPPASPSLRTISIASEADTSVVPDVATFSVSEGRRNRQAGLAKDSVVGYVNRAIAICRRYGIANTDIKTEGLRSSKGINKRGQVVYHHFYQRVDFTFRNLDSLKQAINELVAYGIDVGSLSWSISDGSKIMNALAERSMDKARQQAQTLAKRVGQSVGQVVKITDGSLETLSNNPWGSRRNFTGSFSSSSIKEVQEITINPGEEKFSFKIYVVFELLSP